MPTDMMDDVHILLGGSVTSLQGWPLTRKFIAGTSATEFVAAQTSATATRFVAAVDPLIHAYAGLVRDSIPDKTGLVEQLLHGELSRVCAGGWIGATASVESDVAIGLVSELRRWLKELQHTGRVAEALAIRDLEPPPPRTQISINPAALAYVAAAALDLFLEEERSGAYHTKVKRIQSLLGLKPSEMAHLLDITSEGLRRWERGSPIATERWASIDQRFGTVQRLTRYIKPEVLPAVIRRPVPALGGATPLAWLLGHRDAELLAFYDDIFSYAVTA